MFGQVLAAYYRGCSLPIDELVECHPVPVEYRSDCINRVGTRTIRSVAGVAGCGARSMVLRVRTRRCGLRAFSGRPWMLGGGSWVFGGRPWILRALTGVSAGIATWLGRIRGSLRLLRGRLLALRNVGFSLCCSRFNRRAGVGVACRASVGSFW